jgi:hypothetical protein
MPMITKKTAQTIQPGDIVRVEYGDYENYCNFVFVECNPYVKNCTRITVRYVGSTEIFDIFDLSPIDKITFDVIGREAVTYDTPHKN